MLILLTLLTTTVYAGNKFSNDELLELAQQFVDAKNAKQQPKSSEKDVDAFLALIADKFVDEHVKFGVTVTDKAEFRKSLIAKTKDEVFHSAISIEQVMTGANVVVIKMIEQGKVKPAHLNKVIEYKSTNLVSLEFDDNKLIKHIRRHHG